MRGRAVTGWEDLSWDNEGSGVWAEVEEELRQDVEGKKTAGWELVVSESNDDEEGSEHREAHDLDWLASPNIEKSDRRPVTWKGTGTDQDQVTDSSLVVSLVDGIAASEADSSENNGVVERETVVSDIKQEPRSSRTEEDLAVLPLSVVAAEVLPRGLWDVDLLWCLHGCEASHLIWVSTGLAVKVSSGILVGLLDVAGNIEGVSRSLWNGKTVVECNATWDGTETDDNAPHLVDGEHADASAGLVGSGRLKRTLKSSSDDETHESGGELSETLHREDSTHHGTSPFGGSELGCDDGR